MLWRISNYADLKGRGGVVAAGRWHSAGKRIVYCATSPAGALLEVLVQQALRAEELPSLYQLLRISVSGRVSPMRINSQRLPADWTSRLEATRSIGDGWLAKGLKVLLRVPSAIVPETSNVLINPSHPDVKQLTVKTVGRYPFDARLLR